MGRRPAAPPPPGSICQLAGPPERFLTRKGMALQQMRSVTPGICLLPLALWPCSPPSHDWPSVDGQFTSPMDGRGNCLLSGARWPMPRGLWRVGVPRSPTPSLPSILQLLQLQKQGSRGSARQGQSCAPGPPVWGPLARPGHQSRQAGP